MLSFLELQFLLENYQEKLAQRGVSQEVIDYISSIDDNAERGKAISKVMSNPKLSLKDIEVQKEARISHDPTHFNVLEADPTWNGKYTGKLPEYYQIIAKWNGEVYDKYTNEYKLSRERSIRLPEDRNRVLETLEYYNKNKAKFKTKVISKYEKFQDLEQEYIDVSGQRSKRQEIRDIKMKGSKKLYDRSGWKVYQITTKEAACYYGQNTKWCTAADDPYNYADSYLEDGPLYVFIRNGKEKFQANYDFSQVMDETDVRVDTRDLQKILNLALEIDLPHSGAAILANNFNFDLKYIQRVWEDINVNRLYDSFGYVRVYSSFIKEYVTKRYDFIEKDIAPYPGTCYDYCFKLNQRIEKFEPVILSRGSGDIIGNYAMKIMKSRWKEAEDKIFRIAPAFIIENYMNMFADEFKEDEEANILEKGNTKEIIEYSISVKKKPLPEFTSMLNDKNYLAKRILANEEISYIARYFERWKNESYEGFFDYYLKEAESRPSSENIGTLMSIMHHIVYERTKSFANKKYSNFLMKVCFKHFIGSYTLASPHYRAINHYIEVSGRWKEFEREVEKLNLNKLSHYVSEVIVNYYAINRVEMPEKLMRTLGNAEDWKVHNFPIRLAKYALEINKPLPIPEYHKFFLKVDSRITYVMEYQKKFFRAKV